MIDRRTRILFIITHLELGGAQRQLFYILKNLDKDKYFLYLYAGNRGYLKRDFLNLSHIKVKLSSSLIREINPFLDAVTFLRLLFFIKNNRFDIVHTHSPKASILGRWAAFLLGVKNIIYTVHGWPFHKFMNPFMYTFFLYLERLTAKITKRIIVVSKADLKIGIDKKIAPQDKFNFIHYGVDIEKMERTFLKRKDELYSKELIINISSLKHQKGLYYFLDTAKLIIAKRNKLKFLLIGDGPLKNHIKKAITSYGLKNYVYLAGWVDDLSRIFSKTSVLVLTSLWEGLPLVVLEAIIAGIPAVVTNTGGLLDIVENYRNGIIVKTRDTEKISKAVLQVLDNYDQWCRMIKSYRKNINLYYWSIERMIKDVSNLYGSLSIT